MNREFRPIWLAGGALGLYSSRGISRLPSPRKVFFFSAASHRLAAGEAIHDDPKKSTSAWENVVAIIGTILAACFVVFMFCFRDLLYEI